MQTRRVRVFIDFWNFQLNWNERSGNGKCDWSRLPQVLRRAADKAMSSSELGSLQLEETRIYASYEPSREQKLRGWLHTYLDRLPGVRVFTTERRARNHPAHCRSCGQTVPWCPSCQMPFARAAEKGADAAIVTDLLSLAWEGAYDIALLVSSDADFVPAVERIQEKNFKVINATWRGHGHELARISWASFLLDDLLAELNRAAPR